MEFKRLREAAGMTLAELAKRSGYSVGTINGLELHGEGSERLKTKLLEVLAPLSKIQESVSGPPVSVKPGVELRDIGSDYLTVVECKQRIQILEAEVRRLRAAIRELAAEPVSSVPDDAAAALARRAGKAFDSPKPHPPT